jgi:hypothetical protein
MVITNTLSKEGILKKLKEITTKVVAECFV